MSEKITSKTWSKDYVDNYEKIFGKKKSNHPKEDNCVYSRIDLIGQNGNDGEHYIENLLEKIKSLEAQNASLKSSLEMLRGVIRET